MRKNCYLRESYVLIGLRNKRGMRRLAAICVMFAMAFVLAANVVPHHHHSALVCFEQEDGQHRDSHGTQEHDDSLCIANENYTASARLEAEKPVFHLITSPLPPPALKIQEIKSCRHKSEAWVAERLPSPPLLSGGSLRAPPTLLFS